MVINKRKKNSRQRGSKTHGYGSMKKHRGAGHRGGRGNAGSGKRGDAKKPTFWKDEYFGKKGFKIHNKKLAVPINLVELDKNAERWLAEKKIEKKSDMYIIDLGKLGFSKLIGKGKVLNKYEIKVDAYSTKAKEKLTEIGGKIIENVSVEHDTKQSS